MVTSAGYLLFYNFAEFIEPKVKPVKYNFNMCGEARISLRYSHSVS